MTFTALSVVILTLSACIFYRYIRKGRKKGVTRSLADLACVLFSAFVGVLISIGLSGVIVDSVMDIVTELEFYSEWEDSVPGLSDVSIILLSMVLSLLLYVPTFFVLRILISIIVFVAFKRSLKGKQAASDYLSENEEYYVKRSTFFGGVVGAVSAFMVTVIVFTPLVGILKSISPIIDIYSDIAGNDSASENEVVETLCEFDEDGVATAIFACGGKLFFDMTARTEYHGQTSYINNEIETIGEIGYKQLMDSLSEFSLQEESSADVLLDLIDDADKSLIAKAVLVANVREASRLWLNNKTYLDVERPNLGDNAMVDEFLNEILFVCSTTSFESFSDDVRTLLYISRIFSDKMELFESGDYEVIINELMQDGIANQLRAELDKNDHMRSIIYAVDDLIMSIVVEELYDSHKFSEISRNSLYTNFAEILTETLGLEYSVREESVAGNVESYLTDYGIYLPDGLDETISSMLIQGIDANSTEITPDDVKEFFEQYLGMMGN